MGGCVSFNTANPPPSDLGNNDRVLVNPPPTGNGQEGRAASRCRIEVPFIPTRMLTNGSNENASTSTGMKGTHAMIYEFLLGGIDMVFCGLFDGHGSKGDFVSETVRDTLPLKLLSEWRSLLSGEETTPHHEDLIDEPLEEAEKLPEIFMPLQQSFFKAFESMDRALKEDRMMESFCSGATALTVVKKGRDLLIGNLGKSRAILGTRDEDDNLLAEQLTIDLKPNLATELDRIRRYGGRVFPRKDEPSLCRLFLPTIEAPGLAVSRAFGDFCLKDSGLISVPQVSYHRLAPSDEFLILATHGVWDVLSNEQAVQIVASAPSKELAAKALVDHAVQAWSVKNPARETDDISAIISYLNMENADPDEDPELVFSEVQCQTDQGQVDQVPPPDGQADQQPPPDEVLDKADGPGNEAEDQSEEQEGAKKKKKRGKFHIKMPKFIKRPWGSRRQ